MDYDFKVKYLPTQLKWVDSSQRKKLLFPLLVNVHIKSKPKRKDCSKCILCASNICRMNTWTNDSGFRWVVRIPGIGTKTTKKGGSGLPQTLGLIRFIASVDSRFQKCLKIFYSSSLYPLLFLPQIAYFLPSFFLSLYGLMQTLQNFLFVWLITMTPYTRSQISKPHEKLSGYRGRQSIYSRICKIW